MKLKNTLLLLFLLAIFPISYAQPPSKIISLRITQTKMHPVKIVLHNNINDTILSNIIVKYNANEPFQLIVSESFVNGKIQFKENNKSVFRKEKDIQYLTFTDNDNQERHFAFIPELKQKNIAEIISKGKINYYLIFSDRNIISHSSGWAFIEKDGKWITHKKNISKDYFKKIQSLLVDEPDLFKKLDIEEIPQKEIFKILNEYNSRKLNF